MDKRQTKQFKDQKRKDKLAIKIAKKEQKDLEKREKEEFKSIFLTITDDTKQTSNMTVFSEHNFRTFPINSISSGASMKVFKNLKKLDLSYNRLTTLPTEMEKLQSLVSLQLHHNQFEEIPDCIFNLVTLQNLGLDFNKVTYIKEKISKLSKLKGLSISNNQIIEIPPALCELKTLIWLNLDHNSIVFIPKEVEELSSLQYLYLRDNQITTIPDSFCNLSKLTSAHLSNNLIKQLPNEFGKLNSLLTLSIANNLIEFLPLTFSNLSFDFVDIRSNQIAKTPDINSLIVEDSGNPYCQITHLENQGFTKRRSMRFFSTFKVKV
ncbi:hypothetical protein M0811_09437 [Anaeramoeba ignava]|uniref:Leucine-rich repeat protein n=1 Tax=Anaeramoeba ignava TaxID=1746090 RepID=A0A9Q0LKD3_ANAIG|nr:hypothetical protein M0811_09437 [Anaeramoeba ignava]|eukprot:Anaeramoba_ignava/a610530_26.p1 GENE.a610530_26~~a610530_26.p1  ORF type:complete len:322 (+),score=86.36 a610530_26:19-984(+)